MFEAILIITVIVLIILVLGLAIAMMRSAPDPVVQQQPQPAAAATAPPTGAAAATTAATATTTQSTTQPRTVEVRRSGVSWWIVVLLLIAVAAIAGLITYVATHPSGTDPAAKPTTPGTGSKALPIAGIILKNGWEWLGNTTGAIWDWVCETGSEHILWIIPVLLAAAFIWALWKSKEFRKWIGTLILFAIGGSVICFGAYKLHQTVTVAAEAKLGLPAPTPGEVVKDLTIFTDQIVECPWAFNPRNNNVERTFGKSLAGMDYWKQNEKPGDKDAPDGIITTNGTEVPAMRQSPAKVWLRMRKPKGTPKGEELDEKVRVTQRIL